MMRRVAAAAVPTEGEKQRLFEIQQQVFREGPGGGDMRTPDHRRPLASDMLKETNNMAIATTRVVYKMKKLEEKLDQQVSVLRNQSEGSKVHYLSGQKAGAQQTSKASHQHQLLAKQVDATRTPSRMGTS
jgi:hypothetical protein